MPRLSVNKTKNEDTFHYDHFVYPTNESQGAYLIENNNVSSTSTDNEVDKLYDEGFSLRYVPFFENEQKATTFDPDYVSFFSRSEVPFNKKHLFVLKVQAKKNQDGNFDDDIMTLLNRMNIETMVSSYKKNNLSEKNKEKSPKTPKDDKFPSLNENASVDKLTIYGSGITSVYNPFSGKSPEIINKVNSFSFWNYRVYDNDESLSPYGGSSNHEDPIYGTKKPNYHYVICTKRGVDIDHVKEKLHELVHPKSNSLPKMNRNSNTPKSSEFNSFGIDKSLKMSNKSTIPPSGKSSRGSILSNQTRYKSLDDLSPGDISSLSTFRNFEFDENKIKLLGVLDNGEVEIITEICPDKNFGGSCYAGNTDRRCLCKMVVRLSDFDHPGDSTYEGKVLSYIMNKFIDKLNDRKVDVFIDGDKDQAFIYVKRNQMKRNILNPFLGDLTYPSIDDEIITDNLLIANNHHPKTHRLDDKKTSIIDRLYDFSEQVEDFLENKEYQVRYVDEDVYEQDKDEKDTYYDETVEEVYEDAMLGDEAFNELEGANQEYEMENEIEDDNPKMLLEPLSQREYLKYADKTKEELEESQIDLLSDNFEGDQIRSSSYRSTPPSVRVNSNRNSNDVTRMSNTMGNKTPSGRYSSNIEYTSRFASTPPSSRLFSNNSPSNRTFSNRVSRFDKR